MKPVLKSLLVVLFIGAVAASWWYWPQFHAKRFEQFGWDEKAAAAYGQFGDTFGAFTALFTGVAFVAVALTLYLQMREMQDQRHAIEDGRRREREAEREQRTFHMYHQWTLPEMHGLRTDVWEFLRENVRLAEEHDGDAGATDQAAGSLQQVVFIGGYRSSTDRQDRRLYYSLGSISHFMADLGVMLKAGLLDDLLCYRLLGRSMLQWCNLYGRIDFREGEQDQSERSLNENAFHELAVRDVALIMNGFRQLEAEEQRQAEPGAAADPARHIGSGSS